MSGINDKGTTTKFNVVNPSTGRRLAGVIIRKNSAKDICVICHGMMATKDLGIVRKLGVDLKYNTCRFDFSGNGESEGVFRLSGYEDELADLRTVVEHLRAEGWTVQAIIGHSKGAHIVFRYGWTYDDIPRIVNICGRFDYSRMPDRFTPAQMEDMKTQGFFIWTVKGKDYRIDREDYEARFKIDMAPVANIKRSTVFTIHGRQDDTVPVEDASEWSGLIPKHHLHLINAGHYFIQPAENQEVLRLCQIALLKRVVFEPPPPTNESSV